MSALTDRIFSGKNEPDRDLLLRHVIEGGSDQVELKLKETGWTDNSPAVSLVLDFKDGEITASRIHVLGFQPGTKMTADSLYGSRFNKKSYAKVEKLDYAEFVIPGRMMSDWLDGNRADWVLKVHNSETNKMKTINKLAEEALRNLGANKLWFRLHLALDKGLKILIKTGVAPTSDVRNLIGNAKMNFPMLGVGRSVKADLLPKEPQGAVKNTIADVFNTSCKPTMKYKYSTWKDEVTKGVWDVLEPSYYWPVRRDETTSTQEDEEGETMYSMFTKVSVFNISTKIPNTVQ